MMTEQTEAPLPREAYTLLAQANLLRMRGRWDEAVEKCMAALRLAPDSASAQSLLGDIYENQGRYDDAIQWYRMALDVNPDSPADKIKLDRLQDSGRHRPTDSLHGEQVRVAQKEPSQDRARVEARAERLLRGMAWLAAALFVLAAVLAGVVMSHRHPAPTPITAPPVIVSSSDTNAADSTPGVAEAPPPTPPVTPAPVGDPAEAALLQALQQDGTLAAQSIVPEGVQVDPRQNSVTLTILCPAPSATTPVREALLRGAALGAQAGARVQGDRVGSWTVRCLAPTASGTAPALALVADTTTASLAALGAAPATLASAQLAPAFRNVWWSPSIPQ